MAIFRRYKIAQPVSDRQPDKASLLIWAQREVVLVLKQLRRVVNWAVDWLGYVGIDLTDTPGLLPDKLKVDSTMTEIVGGPEGSRTLTLGANASAIVTEITNSPTLVTNITQTIVNDPVNVTIINEAQPTPATVASRLYPAEVLDPLYKGAARGLLQHGEGGAVLTPTGSYSTWYVGASAARLTVRGPTDLSDDVPVNDDDLVGYWLPDLGAYSPTRAHLGLYQVVDCGEHQVHVDGDPPDVTRTSYTVPVIRRVLNANTPADLCHNSTWSIAPGPVEYSGYGFALTTEDPVDVDVDLLDFSAEPGFVVTAAYVALLTIPQLSQLGASSAVLSISAIGEAGTDLTWPISTPFETVVGTPSAESFPAKLVGFTVESVTISGLTGTAALEAGLYVAGGAEIVRASSPPLDNGTFTNVSWQGLPGAAVSMSPTDRLSVVYFLHYTSTMPVTFSIVYNSPGRGTFVTVPITLPISGAATGDHQHTSRRDQDVASTDPTKADPCHPADAIGPGRLHRNIGVGTISTGILTLPDNASQCHVTLATGTTNIVGIAITRFLDGDPIMIDFPNADSTHKAALSNMADVSSFPTAAPMGLQAAGGVAGGLDITNPTTIWLWLDQDSGRWRFDRKAATS